MHLEQLMNQVSVIAALNRCARDLEACSHSGDFDLERMALTPVSPPLLS